MNPFEGMTYLGDGLYASFDGYQFKLTSNTNETVYLVDHVTAAFLAFMEKSQKMKITISPVWPEEVKK